MALFHSLLSLHLHAVTVVNEFMCNRMDDAGRKKTLPAILMIRSSRSAVCVCLIVE